MASSGENFPYSSESDKLLEDVREGIIRRCFEKCDEAVLQQELDRRVYIQEAPLDTPLDDSIALTLTRDGVRPFREEIDTKEQLILYFTSDISDMVWIEHVQNGRREKFVLYRYGLLPAIEPEELVIDEVAQEPMPEDFDTINVAGPRLSENARLSILREKIDRFLITPQD